jgi:hypothetical protein
MHEASKNWRSARTKKYFPLSPVWQPILALGTLLGFCLSPDYKHFSPPVPHNLVETGELRHMEDWRKHGHTQFWFRTDDTALGAHTNAKKTSISGPIPQHSMSNLHIRKSLPKTRPLDLFDIGYWNTFRGNCDPGEAATTVFRGNRNHAIECGLLDSDQSEHAEDQFWFGPNSVEIPCLDPMHGCSFPDDIPVKGQGKGLHCAFSVRNHSLYNPFGQISAEVIRDPESGRITGQTMIPRPHTWVVTDDHSVAMQYAGNCPWTLPDCKKIPPGASEPVMACNFPVGSRHGNLRQCLDVRHEVEAEHESKSGTIRSEHDFLLCNCQESLLSEVAFPCGAAMATGPFVDYPDHHANSTSAYFDREHVVVQQPLEEVLQTGMTHFCSRIEWMGRGYLDDLTESDQHDARILELQIVPCENHRSLRYIEGHIPFAVALMKAFAADRQKRFIPPTFMAADCYTWTPVECQEQFRVDEVAGHADEVSPYTAKYLNAVHLHFLRSGKSVVGPKYMNRIIDDLYGFGYPKTPRLEELWDWAKWFTYPNPDLFTDLTDEGYVPITTQALERRLPACYRSQFDTFREQFQWPSIHERTRNDPPTPICHNPLFMGKGSIDCPCNDFVFL